MNIMRWKKDKPIYVNCIYKYIQMPLKSGYLHLKKSREYGKIMLDNHVFIL